ncbi:MAG: ATP-binding protein [Solirubrobacterales bacterium]
MSRSFARRSSEPSQGDRSSANVSFLLRISQLHSAHIAELVLLPRHIQPELDAALEDTPVVVIVGPRQCGKSTLAGQLADRMGATQISLDDAGPRQAANADPTGFVDEARLPVLIDEFQKAPQLIEAIKSRVDRARRAGQDTAPMFLLTGSANVWSTLRIAESLAGRAQRVQLWPFSQGELHRHRETFLEQLVQGIVPSLSRSETGRAAIAEPMLTGGYPEMVSRSGERRRSRWIENYLAMILERDVRDLSTRGQQLAELPRLLGVASSRVANLLDVTSLARAVGMNRDTVNRYLTLLEMLFLVRRTPAWSRNIGQRLIKSPKLWLPDSGLACSLVGYSRARFLNDETSLAGALFENFVAGEITKQASWADADLTLHHFRTGGGREIDIVIEAKDGSLAGIEVKLAATPSERDFSGLRHLRDKLGKRFKAGVLIHTGPDRLPFGERLWALPVKALWS